ncbi:hypothetical protein [Candidatus Cloacimonas acidaminovorans]|jgi:hypothetical protein|uniref:Uncharacterized protein n=1 Tax=Cloacimonas acidaminovorans (strain Evry) TaxID=459349 RepID=B0VHQ2_CLOAI|nr:hypothetical protein [Candidatus Cloacimonas acidaminovorans]CAO80867.1 hypothetical protein CLOAM0995 [Candidatus Cloacimonas acidaminovorans str. Evry]
MRKDNTNLKVIDIKQVISLELNQHPELKLIDIYKLVFQAYLGPAHLLADTNDSAKKIMTEILLHPEPYKPLKQDIGSQHGFFRLSLDFLVPVLQLKKEKAISELYRKSFLLAELMQESVLDFTYNLDITKLWKETIPVIQQLIVFDLNEWQQVNTIAESKAIPRHSQQYKTLYNPKYRVLKYQFYDDIEKLLQ